MSTIFKNAERQANKLNNISSVLDQLYGKQDEQIVAGLEGLGENIVYRQDSGQTNFDEETDWYGDAEEVAAAYADDQGTAAPPLPPAIEVKQRATPKPLDPNDDPSLWIDPDTGIMHKIEEPKEAIEESDDRPWYTQLGEAFLETLVYGLTAGIVDMQMSPHDITDKLGFGDLTQWGLEKQEEGVEFSMPTGVGGVAGALVPTVGVTKSGVNLVQTPLAKYVADIFKKEKDEVDESYTDADAGVELPKFTRGALREQVGLSSLKKKLDEE